MTKRIIYTTDDGRLAVVMPAPECLETYTIEEIALKDVPFGKPFKIVEHSDIPTDNTFRDAWEVDPSILTDGVGAESNEFPSRG
jgi:hypothetical protein